MPSEMLAYAIHYASRGWSIVPVAAGTKDRPCVKWKPFQTKPADELQLRKWFANGSRNMAVLFGVVSGGLACRDFDTMEAYQAWAASHPDFAEILPTVATSRGRHVYFRTTAENLRFVDLRTIAPPEDGEYRGDSRHYCLLPPSRHPSGIAYRWLVALPDGEIPIVADVRAAGLLPHSVDTEHTERHNKSIAVCSAASVSAVFTVSSASSAPFCVTDIEEENTAAEMEKLIRGCLPTGPGRRNRQVFELARAIKAVAGLADADPDELRHIVKRWHTLALPNILTREFTETWIDFLQAWPRVKSPKGAKMAAIMEKALQLPMPKAAERYEDEGIRRLVALCKQLDREANGGTFYLSCRTAAALLGVSHMQANRWLFLLDHDEVVKQVNKGDRGKRQAAEYRYVRERE